MALVLGNPNGQFRGKLGGQVFSANKAGAIVRSYVKPTSPNTAAQLRARSAFGSAVSGFSTLTSAQRAHWQEYAQNHFKPKQLSNSGVYSGFQAYMGLAVAVNSALTLTRTYNLYMNGNNVNSFISPLSWIPTLGNPPTSSKSQLIKDETGYNYPIFLTEANVDQDGNLDFTLQYYDGISGLPIINNLDANDHNNGYVMFMSNGNVSDNMSYKKPMQYSLGYIPPWQKNSAPAFPVNNIKIETSDSFNTGVYSDFPLAHEFVVLTLYLIDRGGAMARLASLEVEVQP